MKKLFTPSLKKLNLYLIISCAMLLLFINSCKKEFYSNEKIDPLRREKLLAYKNGPQMETINFAQFKNIADLNDLGKLRNELTKTPSSQQKTMSVNIPETFAGFQVLTDSIKVIRDKEHTMYVFPVKLSSKRTVSFQNLTIDQSNGKTKAFINTYTPTKKWIADWRAGKAGKFDGDIAITFIDLNNSGALSLPSLSNNQTSKGKVSVVGGLMNSDQTCITTTYYYTMPYNCGSGSHGPTDSGCALIGADAAGYANFSFNMTKCIDMSNGGGGGGGDGSGTTPNPPGGYNPCDEETPPITSVKNGASGLKLMVKTTAPCEEYLPDLEEPEAPTKEITNNLTDTCLKATIAEALATNKDVKGFLSTLINKYSQLNNGIKINITNSSITKPAETTPSFERDGTFKAEIVFQNGYYDDVSKEAVVGALIHEVVHAYLYQTNSTYKNQPKAAQHNFLFTNFVHDIGSYLMNKYNMIREDAYGLAWSGMGDIYNDAGDNDTFIIAPAIPATDTTPATPAKYMTKTALGGAVAPYKFIGTGAKGTPNCPN
ncbi:MAG: hypothetical protein V4546_01465 [Bacteroidota bacterium]